MELPMNSALTEHVHYNVKKLASAACISKGGTSVQGSEGGKGFPSDRQLKRRCSTGPDEQKMIKANRLITSFQGVEEQTTS